MSFYDKVTAVSLFAKKTLLPENDWFFIAIEKNKEIDLCSSITDQTNRFQLLFTTFFDQYLDIIENSNLTNEAKNMILGHAVIFKKTVDLFLEAVKE